MKNHLKMNHPRMNPEMKRSEYHLSETGPILKISGFICQFTANVSIIHIKIKACEIRRLCYLFADCCDTREFLAFEVLEHCSTTC